MEHPHPRPLPRPGTLVHAASIGVLDETRFSLPVRCSSESLLPGWADVWSW